MKLSFFKTYHLFLLSLASLQRKHPTIGRTECTNADFDSEIDFSLDAEPGRPDVLLDVGHGSDAAVPAVAGRWPRSVTGRRRWRRRGRRLYVLAVDVAADEVLDHRHELLHVGLHVLAQQLRAVQVVQRRRVGQQVVDHAPHRRRVAMLVSQGLDDDEPRQFFAVTWNWNKSSVWSSY